MSHYTGSVPASKHRPDWRAAAACRAGNVDPDAMFPDSDKTRIEHARRICAGCPVSRACLRDAINSGDNQWGIRGGLTPEERRSVKKEINRRIQAAAAQQANQADAAVRTPVRGIQRKPYSSLRELLDVNTKRVVHGHLAWTGPAKPTFKGRTYNPKQVAFILDRGRAPVGRVLTTCGVSGCVLPAHVADDEERMANADADNRLRRTGTTKVTA